MANLLKMEDLYPEDSERMVEVATKMARERGASFPLPAVVREASKPVPHWEVLAAPEGQERTCIMLDHRGQFLNLERRPVTAPAPRLSWWKKLLGLNAPPS